MLGHFGVPVNTLKSLLRPDGRPGLQINSIPTFFLLSAHCQHFCLVLIKLMGEQPYSSFRLDPYLPLLILSLKLRAQQVQRKIEDHVSHCL